MSGAYFSKAPRTATFRVPKASCQTAIRLFWRGHLLTCFWCKQDQEDCEVSWLGTSALRRYKGKYGTGNRLETFRDCWKTGAWCRTCSVPSCGVKTGYSLKGLFWLLENTLLLTSRVNTKATLWDQRFLWQEMVTLMEGLREAEENILESLGSGHRLLYNLAATKKLASIKKQHEEIVEGLVLPL